MPEPLHCHSTSTPEVSSTVTTLFARFPREALEHCIPARFELLVRQHPKRVAVIHDDITITYGDLNALANRIARAVLATCGYGPQPVALLAGSGVPFVAAMLGVLKAGKFYVALDASQPIPRAMAILAECKPALLIADDKRLEQAEVLRSLLGPNGVSLLNVDTLEPSLSEDNVDLTIASTDLAYVIYTSGSMGKPKGVMQDHRYLLHLVMVYTNSGRISVRDRVALLYSPSFAGAVRDIYCALLNGAALATFDVKRDGLKGLSDWLRQEQITVFFAVATMFRHFCRLLSPADRFPSVRLIELGSETVYVSDVHLYQRHFFEDCELMVNLGGSELSPVSQFLVHVSTQFEGTTVPAGYAVEDVELQLWDSEGKPVATGTAGEIVVRSRYMSRGYLNRPELTEATFLPDPEGGDRRLFRTGDVGRMLPDGCLVHLGRCDLQVKIRGYRVETTEVEAFLSATGFFRDVAVAAWPNAAGEQNLGAWLVPLHPPAPPSINELRALFAANLPDYMVPTSFVFMDSLPLTDAGKLDRRALPDPLVAGRQGTGYIAPRTAVEGRLKEIWSEVLGQERIGIHDNFFDLGGHSLLALQVVARASAAFRVMLPQNCIFKSSTLAQLAEVVELARSLETDETLRPAPTGASSPLSLAQQRLWVLAEMEGPSDTFNIERAFHLEGTLDLTALERALAVIGGRHDNLRASFQILSNGPAQLIGTETVNVLNLEDLRYVPESRRQAALEASLQVAHRQRFDLANGPLWSVCVMRLAWNRYVLHLAMHHIIGDDWSVQVLLRELATIYGAELAGEDDPIPKLLVQYADYAAWQRRWLTSERLGKQLAYWREHLRDAPPVVVLPLDRPRHAGGQFHAGSVRLRVGRELTAQLKQLSRGAETTLFVTLFAAYALLLSRYGNQRDIVIGTGLANRYPVETETLIGFFVSTIALRLKWRSGASFREIQTCAHRAAVNGYAHADVPFDRIVEELQPERGTVHSPIFQTLFVLQNVSQQALVLPGLVTAPIDLSRPSAGATFDLTLSLTDTGVELRGALEFNAALFDTATIECMSSHFGNLLSEIVLHPDAGSVQQPLLGSTRL